MAPEQSDEFVPKTKVRDAWLVDRESKTVDLTTLKNAR